jgi:L-amino acid N-acyltransferase YncA
MKNKQRLSFDASERKRIYEYVERQGTADRGEVRKQVLVTPESASKPTRSGRNLQQSVQMDAQTFDHHVTVLKRDGYLEEDDGRLRVALTTDDTWDRFDAGGHSVTIRPARQEDITGIVGVIREVVEEKTHIVAESVAEELDRDEVLLRHNESESRMFFVATIDDEVVGWLHLRAPQFEKLRHTAELTTGVLEPYRSLGIGSRLMEKGLTWARAQDYRKVYQSLPATNQEAIDFLETHGWTVEATRAEHYLIDDEFVDEIMLAKRLD